VTAATSDGSNLPRALSEKDQPTVTQSTVGDGVAPSEKPLDFSPSDPV